MPEKIVLHPLTRIGTDPNGKPALVVHLEMRDRFGQSIKALGRLRVELYKPVSDGSGGVQAQDVVWNVDLSNPERNALLYDDLVTRTYTVTLGDLPEWLLGWAAATEKGVAPTVKATFVCGDGKGGQKTLTDTLRLMK